MLVIRIGAQAPELADACSPVMLPLGKGRVLSKALVGLQAVDMCRGVCLPLLLGMTDNRRASMMACY